MDALMCAVQRIDDQSETAIRYVVAEVYKPRIMMNDDM